MMRAAVVEQPGGPEVLQLRDIPRPQPRAQWVLLKVKAFGLNRSEMYTRQGHSGDAVRFPRVLGIECVGEVVAAPGSDLAAGQKVAALMGGMGRAFDGSYAEYTLVPGQQVIPLTSDLPWPELAAVPETFLTAWGSLQEAMAVKAGRTLLVRGGTSSVGMAAITMAKEMGLTVIATTRQESKRQALLANGADRVIIDSGRIAPDVKKLIPDGAPYVLELVGAMTLLDSLQAAAPHGVACNTGILGDAWVMPSFEPLTAIPSTVNLTVYSSHTVTAASAGPELQKIVTMIEEGKYRLNLERVFKLEQIAEAHQRMEANRACGKLVVSLE